MQYANSGDVQYCDDVNAERLLGLVSTLLAGPNRE